MKRLRYACEQAATVLLALAATSYAETGDQPSSPDGEPALSYRRIYAPADRMDQWPTGGERFLPIDADELDRLLEHARRHAMDAPVEGVPFVRTARFAARLDGATLRDGKAELEVVHAGESEALLLMDGLTPAMGSATWNDDPATPAVAGRWSDGLFGVLVRKPGTLVFPWSQNAARDMAGDLRFRLRLPRADQRELLLTLPSGLVPRVDHGVVVSGPTDGNGPSVWRLRLEPEATTTLRVRDRPFEDSAPSEPLQSLLVYDIAPEGIDVTASFSIGIAQQDTELQLSVAAPLRVSAVLLDGQPVPWRSVSDPATEDLYLLVEVERADDVLRKQLVVRALAPVRLNRLVRLPRVRVRGAQWESGRTKIFINDPLKMMRLEVDGCIQIDAEPRAATRSGDSLELADYQPDASVEIQLARDSGGSQWLHASAVVVGPDEATSTTTLRWTGVADPHRLVTPRIDPEWVITEVQSQPPGLVRFWDVDQTDAAWKHVVIECDGKAASQDGLLIRLTGRRAWTPARGTLRLADLSMLANETWRAPAPLLCLRAAEPYRLHVEGNAPLNVVADKSLPPDEAVLLDAPQRSWIVRCNREAMQCRLSLIRRTPEFQADVRLEFLVDRTADVLRERYSVRCSPQAGRVNRFRIHFHGPRAGDLKWEVPGGEALPVVFPGSERDNKASGAANTTAWDIVLERPKRAPFTVSAHRRRSSSRAWRMPLISVPDASAAEAQVVVRSVRPSDVGIRAVQLERIENEPSDINGFSDVRATFAYDATADGIALAQGSLVLDAHGNRRLPAAACAGEARLFSKVAQHGESVHTATYSVHNMGRETMNIRLPPRTRLLAAWIDGRPVAVRHTGGNDSSFSVDLPQRRQCNVVVQFQESGGPLGSVHWIARAMPSTDMPVLSHRWTIALPPPYVALREPGGRAAPRESLLGRLLGPLAGTDHRRPAPTRRAFDGPVPRTDLVGAANASAATPMRPPGNLISLHGFRAGGSDVEQRGIAVVNQQQVLLLGLGIFALFTTLFAVYLSGVSLRIVLVFATAISALLLPDAVVPLASAAFFGAVVGQGLRLILPVGQRKSSENAEVDARSSEPSGIAVAGPALLVALLSATSAVRAAEPAEDKGEAPVNATDTARRDRLAESDTDNPVYTIWIPIDDELHPTNAARYISEAFFEKLYRQSHAASRPPRAWTLAEAHYNVAIATGEADGEYRVSHLTAHYDIVVIGQQTDVEIPLRAAGSGWKIERPRIDSHTSTAHYQAARGRVAISALSTGRHHVTVPMRQTSGTSGQPWLDLQIPRVPNSRMRVTMPAGLDNVCVPDANGHVRRAENGQLIAELGSTSRLRLTWPSKASARSNPSVPPVRELYWWKVRPAGVAIDARLRLTPWQLRRKEIRLLADPRLRLAPVPGDSLIKETQVLAGRPQSIILRLRDDVDGRDRVDLRLLLADASGIGHLQFPYVHVQAACPSRALVAVSFGRALQFREKVHERLTSVDGTSFLEAWGGAPNGDVPQAAYLVPSGAMQWMVAARPRGARYSCRQMLTIEVGKNHAHLVLSAEIEPIEGQCFQYRLAVPLELEIESVAVREDGAGRPVQWSSGPPGYVNVFLSEPLVQTGRIQLEGTMPVRRSGEMPLPMIRVEQARTVASTVHLLRRPDVRVQLVDAVGLRATESSAEVGLHPGSSRPVATYEVVQQPVSARLTVRDKEVRADATMLTTMRRRSSGWHAVVDLLAEVAQGPVDDIAFNIPVTWAGPYRVEPGGRTHVVSLPEGAGRQLWVRPPEPPVSGRYQLRVTSPLESTPGIIPRPPNIYVRIEGALRRLIALPKQWNGQTLRWDTQGLVEVAWKTAADLGVPAPHGFHVFEIVAERFSAVPRTVASRGGTPTLHRADTEIAITSDHATFGVTTFEFDPAGASRCRLRAAAGMQIEQIVVNGSAASYVATDRQDYDVLLGPPRVDQRVEVVFSYERSETVWRSPQVASIERPRLLVGERPVSTEATTWQIHVPPDVVVTGLEPARRLSHQAAPQRAIETPNDDRVPVSDILVRRALPGTRATAWVTPDEAPILRVRVESRYWSPALLGWIVAMVLAWACLASLAMQRRPWGRDLLWRWPHVALVLAGWIAAMTVQPAFFGWAAMVAGAVLALIAAPSSSTHATRAVQPAPTSPS